MSVAKVANLTITVDDETLRRARARAVEEGSSINAILREYLEAYSRRTRAQQDALMDLLALADSVMASRGKRRWTRDELHQRK
ncbi:MAG: ribbon-helix-helix protein, CopG family [Nevskia sp.]|nr:ribbon-helix-helix protein, CopG family [Nevskia sp.]